MNTWRARRPFYWGALLILDRDSSDIPPIAEAVVSRSAHGLAVQVLHAQDVDLNDFEPDDVIPQAQVSVEVFVRQDPGEPVIFSGEIEVPSGVLTLGDAKKFDELEVGPGRWRVQVSCTPIDFSEHVRVWLQPR